MRDRDLDDVRDFNLEEQIADRRAEDRFDTMRDEAEERQTCCALCGGEDHLWPECPANGCQPMTNNTVEFCNHVDNRSKYRSSIGIGDWTFFGHTLTAWLKNWCLEVEYKGIRYGAANLGGSTQDFKDVTGVNEYDGLATWEQHKLMQKYVEMRADKFVDAHGNKLSEEIA